MSRTLPLLVLAATMTSALPAWAQEADEASAVPQRTINILVYGDDACPEARSEDEIVVCARQPEEERYRVPRRFRDRGDRPMEVAWGARVAELEDAQRTSCSTEGPFGYMGCTQSMISRWYAERREMARERERNR